MGKFLNKFQILSFMFFVLGLSGCSSNKIVFPTQIEYSTTSQNVVDAFIVYIESKGYTVLNPNDTRMTMRSQNGFLAAEYLETDWKRTDFFHQETGSEYIVKQKIWITLDMPGTITVESVFGFNQDGEFIVSKNASPDLHRVIVALPEGLKSLIASKSL